MLPPFSSLALLLWSAAALLTAPLLSSVGAFAPSQRLHFTKSAAVPASRFAPLSVAAQQQAMSLPNPFKKLPWNVKKEREREARRRKVERAKLHRQLGIAEDASYEEIVEATDRRIMLAGKDLRAKVQVEVAKDKILQFRLNERLAGLQAESKEARAMSN